MNQDQLFNSIQKLVVLFGGAAIAKGYGDQNWWEGIGGVVAAGVTWYISHKWNATPAPIVTSPKTDPDPHTPTTS